MTISHIIRVVLVIVVLGSFVSASPTESASACSCVQNAPQSQLETYRQAAIVRAIGRIDNKLIYEVHESYGVQLPEQISISPSQCDPGGLFDHTYGFSVYGTSNDWKFAPCSGTGDSEMRELAATLSLERFTPLPSTNTRPFVEIESELAELPSQSDQDTVPAQNELDSVRDGANGVKTENWVAVTVLGALLLLLVARRFGWRSAPNR